LDNDYKIKFKPKLVEKALFAAFIMIDLWWFQTRNKNKS
jgi:hypothetical protein